MSTFNNEKTIMYSLDSINNINSHILVEIVIVNDGSSDNTRKIIDSYNFVIQNHIIHLESNIGRGYALNMAIRMSKGKYIAIIDADDLELNQRLEKSVDVLTSDKFALTELQPDFKQAQTKTTTERLTATKRISNKPVRYKNVTVLESNEKTGETIYKADSLRDLELFLNK